MKFLQRKKNHQIRTILSVADQPFVIEENAPPLSQTVSEAMEIPILPGSFREPKNTGMTKTAPLKLRA